jgi:nucleoid-associated protein YgaU
MPSVRPDKPTSSPQPAVTPGATPPDSPADSSPVQNDSAVPGIHVVQKGETLVKIARKHYSNTSTPVLDFLMRSNRGKLKDPHYVVEGQKLMIPVLPVSLGGAVRSEVVASPDLDSVEAADPLLSTRNGSGLRPLSSERFAPPTSALVRLDQNRTASDSSSAKRPTPSPDPAAGHKVVNDRASQKQVREAAEGGPASGSADETKRRGDEDRSARKSESKPPTGDKRPSPSAESTEGAYRWYTIRPKDTLASIANRELGGTDDWEDIVKLNKSLKPTKMKVGDKIRLPKRRPASDSAASSKRSST